MDEREEALRIYGEMQVYDWDEKDGYMPNDYETKKKCRFMMNYVITNCHDNDKDFYRRVKLQLNNL